MKKKKTLSSKPLVLKYYKSGEETSLPYDRLFAGYPEAAPDVVFLTDESVPEALLVGFSKEQLPYYESLKKNLLLSITNLPRKKFLKPLKPCFFTPTHIEKRKHSWEPNYTLVLEVVTPDEITAYL